MHEFPSIGHFMTHFVLAVAHAEKSAHQALDKAATVLQKDMEKQLGQYQPAVGYFNGWTPLAESTLVEHARFGVGDTPLLLHGGLYGSISHEVIGHEAMAGSTSDIAVWQELGTATIPPRAFVGPAGMRNAEKVAKILGHAFANGLLYGSGETLTPLTE